jgi:eukaryotic-like serine/threonine-protein kinase
MVLPTQPRAGREFLGNYRLGHLIGQGASARVYRGEHLFLKRIVAIKILSCDFARWPDFDLKIFESTATRAARLNHPNIVALYDIDEVRTRPYIVMEYVDGPSLQALLRRGGPLAPLRATRLLREIALALDHAHAAGVVHCDIKPGNILIDPKGRAKVTDFGLSRALHQTERSGILDGVVAGTPSYISPEQVQAQHPDQRSDLYSLGATLFEMLTGESAFRGRSDSSMFEKHLHETRSKLPALPQVARPLQDVLFRRLARHPQDRYQTAAELLRDLRPMLNRPTRPASRPVQPRPTLRWPGLARARKDKFLFNP